MSAALPVQMLDDDAQPGAFDLGKALRQAFQLGQTYWQQADSQSYSENRRSDVTHAKFQQLVADALSAAPVAPVPADGAHAESVQSFLDLARLYCAVTDTPSGDLKWTFAQGDMEDLAAEIVRQNQRNRTAPVARVQRERGYMGSTPDGGFDDHDEPELPAGAVATIEDVIHTLTHYNPAADEYKGKFIHKGLAEQLRAALATQAAPVDTKPAEAA